MKPLRWTSALAPLGQAGVELLRAELGALNSELQGSSRVLVRALLLLAVALFVLFWAIGALAYVLVEVAALWLPRWGAAVSVLGVFLLASWVLVIVARRRLRSVETPLGTVRRRLDEHRNWWERRVALQAGSARESGPDPAHGPRSESADDFES